MNAEAATVNATTLARETLARKSKSFALAGRLLPSRTRDDMAVLYAWCRHVDDAIDLVPVDERASALVKLRAELDEVYEGTPTTTLLAELARLVRRTRIPRTYTEELLSGMEMDVVRVRYETVQDLELYCYRVAGVVGLMACHVLGISDPTALRNAAHLGMAMQLTNVCRDVDEDLADGRVYLPRALLEVDLVRAPEEGSAAREAVKRTVERLLAMADRLYRSADEGLGALDPRVAVGIRVARHVYAAIGRVLGRRKFDPFLGRAVVPFAEKLWLVALSIASSVGALLISVFRRRKTAIPDHVLRFPHDVLPV